ncbi:crossover junction endodeoxyribonuclease RuvC [Aggregicoccus sp. 17bor-14]|uniref:crossover junction endodeoxyribonuclease RuvC n=1 Tax=Myxococcaceae TaxID=31 RepID=UPI00129D165D|nr:MULTISPECIES: crossover junction endodeoxyribonuclease RuvC [Myxococcaceae]MBF5042569.1 crossover junction endodeoxyribonuclease RuvC [Simulacricoccus sp. 17bor-14]MRI88338.1 crossover junction endodeoxyribonuclease RuvC [Aggregicoccus sp. 17bor-14]
MRVLGVDPGSRFMGYGVVEERRGRLVHVGHGVIKVDPDAPLEQRLMVLHTELAHAIALYKPAAVAVEGLFTFRNARSALVLGHARGVALLAASQAGLSVHEYAPSRVKKAVGAGGADGKDAVARMVRIVLQMPELAHERADSSDALAVALCHLNLHRGALASGAAQPAQKSGARGKKGAFAHLEGRLSPSYKRPEAG